MTQESTVATHLSNVGVIVLIPQSFTDQEKSMYLAFRDAAPDCLRAKVRRIIIGWIIFLATLRCSLLSMTIDADEENRKEFAIEDLLQRQKYNAAFNVATG